MPTRSMHSDRLVLADIGEAASAIARFVAGVEDEQAFHDDELRQSAVLQKFIVIGEAASRVSATFRDQHPEIEWRDIIAFRNIAVHAYFSVDWSIVWVAATQDAPRLHHQIAALLADFD